MGKIAQRMASRQSWAGKWADRVSRLLRQERRTRDLAAGDAVGEAASLAGLLEDPIEELLSCADHREFNRALDLLYSASSTQNLAEEADTFSLLLEEYAGSVYWERGEGEALRTGESQLFAVGLVATQHQDAGELVLEEVVGERLRKALVDTHQVSAQARIVLLPLLVGEAHELELDAWQERRLAQGLHEWAFGHIEEDQPDASQARRILALAGQNKPGLPNARRDKGHVALRSHLVLGLIIPPGETIEDAPEPAQDLKDEPIGKYFPRREMASLVHDLRDVEQELEIVLDLRCGITPADVDPQEAQELKALYAEDRLVDLEADLKATRSEIEDLRQQYPQLVTAVESETFLEAYEKTLAEALAPIMGDDHDPAPGVRYATEAGPLPEVLLRTFEGYRLIAFEIGALLAARSIGRTSCEGWVADLIVDEKPGALDVQIFDGGLLVHETQWPVHSWEDDDSAADQLVEALDVLGIRLLHDVEQDEAPLGGEGMPTLQETEVIREVEAAQKVGEEQESSESKSRRNRRNRNMH